MPKESCLRDDKPIHRRQLVLVQVPPEFPLKPRRQGRDDHVGFKAFPVPADGHRPPLVLLGELRENARAHLVEVRVMDKQLTSRFDGVW